LLPLLSGEKNMRAILIMVLVLSGCASSAAPRGMPGEPVPLSIVPSRVQCAAVRYAGGMNWVAAVTVEFGLHNQDFYHVRMSHGFGDITVDQDGRILEPREVAAH
jgi:hypothetical protein